MTINLKKTNFAKSKLSGALLTAGMSFSITSAEGAKFPAIGAGYPFRAIIFGASYGSPDQDSTREIIECYRNGADAFTITARGLEGTTAKDWSDQDNIFLGLTAGVLAEIEAEVNGKISSNLGNNPITAIKTASFNGEIDNGNSGTAKTIDWTNGQVQKVVLNGNCTFTFIPPVGVCTVTLKIIHDATATAYTPVFPASLKKSGAFANTNTANAVDKLTMQFDGTNYWGMLGVNFI